MCALQLLGVCTAVVGAEVTAVDKAVNGHFFPQMTKCTQCALAVAANAADLISPS